MDRKRVLVIVAHPDDETIWMGGTLVRNRENWDIGVISLCRANDPDRSEKFKKVCKRLNLKSFISDLEDEELYPISLDEIKKRVICFTEGVYDYVFTHGKNGEYGHIRHIEINNAVREMVKEKSLNVRTVFFFSYIKKNACGTDTGFDSIANKNANKFIKLSDFEFSAKKFLIKEVYGFRENSFEERSCRKEEAFDVWQVEDR